MKRTFKLSDAKERTLQQLSLNHLHRDCRIRAAALLLRSRGLTVESVADELYVNCQSIYNWPDAWREFGVCGLLGGHQAGHNGGRPRVLPEEMLATAITVANSEPMTLVQIGQYVEGVHGEPIPYHLETLGMALKRAGFTRKTGVFLRRKGNAQRFVMKTIRRSNCSRPPR
jgi:Transposase and inactivated derivatives